MNELIHNSLDKKFINEGYNSRTIGIWLLLTAGLIFFMIGVGGYTRLTKAGLSMTKWKAFGYKFPTTKEEWEKEFEWYKTTPEYLLTNKGMSLD